MATYEDLRAIVMRIEKRGVNRLRREELHALPGLYRTLVSELAEARARGAGRARLTALEALAVRAHAVLYAPAPIRLRQSAGAMVMAFPATVRAAWRPLLLAVGLTIAGGVWGFFEVQRAPESAAALLPGGLQLNAEEGFQQGHHGRGSPFKGAFYFTHNATVALNAFSLGITFGVGTTLALLFNGVVLGATFAVVRQLGSLQALFGFILPHSGIELTAIFIAAAGGLRMAGAVLHPGWKTRTYALMTAAREALPLAVGAAAMLAVAGLVEGWISPMALPLWGKGVIGATLDAALAFYLFAMPRGGVPTASAQPSSSESSAMLPKSG